MTDPDRFAPVMQRMQAGQAAVGFGLSSTSLRGAETFAALGGDFVAIDLQHGEAQLSDLPWLCKAITHNGMPTLVRAASKDEVFIQRTMDLGADAIVVPMVNTIEQAREVVRCAKFPPLGERSFGPVRGPRVNAEYLETANQRHPVFIMLETREAIDNAEAMLSIDGIAGGTIGPADLSISMGYNPLAGPLSDEVEDAIARAGAAAQAAGKIAGGFFGPVARDVFDRRVAQGYRIFLFGHEFRLIQQAGQQLLESLGRG